MNGKMLKSGNKINGICPKRRSYSRNNCGRSGYVKYRGISTACLHADKEYVIAVVVKYPTELYTFNLLTFNNPIFCPPH